MLDGQVVETSEEENPRRFTVRIANEISTPERKYFILDMVGSTQRFLLQQF